MDESGTTFAALSRMALARSPGWRIILTQGIVVGKEVTRMARQDAVRKTQAERRLRVVTDEVAVGQTPILNLEQIVFLYAGLLEQTRQLDELLEVLREQILRAMNELGIKSVREDEFEVIRQIRHRAAKLDEKKAEALLLRFGRLEECLTPQLDEQKVRQVLEELRAAGRIPEDQMPYVPVPESEALIVRRGE